MADTPGLLRHNRSPRLECFVQDGDEPGLEVEPGRECSRMGVRSARTQRSEEGGPVGDGDIPVGIYWSSQAWALARSAFVAELDEGGSRSLTEWIRLAIDQHATLQPAARAQLAQDAPPAAKSRGFSKTHPLPVTTLDAMDAAIRADRAAGRVISQAEFVREAATAAAAATRARLGRELPPAPDRLPNRWPTRTTRP